LDSDKSSALFAQQSFILHLLGLFSRSLQTALAGILDDLVILKGICRQSRL
jgi:hypothetical protein